MAEIGPSYIELPTYFAEGAFAATRLGHSAIQYNTDLLEEASAFMNEEIGRGLPGTPDNVTFVYRFAEPGYKRPQPDPNFTRANPGTLYVPAKQLALPSHADIAGSRVSKAFIQDLGAPVMQVQISETRPPSMLDVAESVLYPLAEDHRFIASLGAWRRQVKKAFTPAESVTNKRRILEEVTARFSGAILLKRRGE